MDEAPSRQTDLVISNSGWTGVEKVTVNGVDRGKLPPMGVIALQDVGEGRVRVEAFVRAGDAAPCATFERNLHGGERVPFAIDCSSR